MIRPIKIILSILLFLTGSVFAIQKSKPNAVDELNFLIEEKNQLGQINEINLPDLYKTSHENQSKNPAIYIIFTQPHSDATLNNYTYDALTIRFKYLKNETTMQEQKKLINTWGLISIDSLNDADGMGLYNGYFAQGNGVDPYGLQEAAIIGVNADGTGVEL